MFNLDKEEPGSMTKPHHDKDIMMTINSTAEYMSPIIP